MARKMECIAMLLAGGQGSRLGILTKKHPLFVFEEQGEMDGRVKGHLVRTKTVFSATGKAERAGVIL